MDLRRGSPEASEGLVINAERVLGDVRAAGHLAGALGVPDAVRRLSVTATESHRATAGVRVPRSAGLTQATCAPRVGNPATIG